MKTKKTRVLPIDIKVLVDIGGLDEQKLLLFTWTNTSSSLMLGYRPVS